MSNLKKALNLEKNIIIRACAGAGKTYALAKRYLAILDDFAGESLHHPHDQWQGPGNILVITFTKKATAEMAGRIYHDLHRILAGEHPDEQGLGRKILNHSHPDYRLHLLESFSRAQIMTIDALCSRIIRENPIQSGIDPAVNMEDETLAQKLVSTTINEYLQSLFVKNDDALLMLLDNMGLLHLKNAISTLLKFPHEIQRREFMVGHLAEEKLFQQWREMYEPAVDCRPAVEKLLDSLESALSLIIPNPARENLATLYEACERFLGSSHDDRPMIYRDFIFPRLITKKERTYHKQMTSLLRKKAEWDADKEWKDNYSFISRLLKSTLDELRSLLPEEQVLQIFTRHDGLMAKLISSLLPMVEQIRDILRQKKQEAQILSFDDVLMITHRLLKENPAIAEKYHRQYRHIMVDEFQDTNNLRWEIVKMIASGEEGVLRSRGLFIVGDEKQSIYRFQNADVKVMSGAEADLSRCTESPRLIRFNLNFRSSEPFIRHAINPLFTHVFPNGSEAVPPYVATFQPTEYPVEEKGEDAKTRDQQAGGFLKLDIFTVAQDFLKGAPKPFKQDVLAYPRHVARVIRAFQETETYRNMPATPGKPRIGVLLRRVKNNITLYREAFRQEGLNFEVFGSSGFYQRQEVLDVHMLLSVLVNPRDDVAMTGLLRSPVFALDDGSLTDFFTQRPTDISVYDHLKETFPPVWEEINRWLRLSVHTPPDRLLQDIFRCGYRELGYLSETDGQQRWKNLRKCIHLIHQMSVSGKSLAEICNALGESIQYETGKEFAPLPSESEIVLMSIHKSKGLDFPVVVIPDLHRKLTVPNRDGAMLADLTTNSGHIQPEIALSLSPIDGNDAQSVMAGKVKDQIRVEEQAELDRLLYVAVTRAKYGVIFSGVAEEGQRGYQFGSKDSWLKKLAEIYGLESAHLTGEEDFHHDHVELSITPFQPAQNHMDHTQPEEVPWDPPKIPHWDRPLIIHRSAHDLSELVDHEDTAVPPGTPKWKGRHFGTLVHKILEKKWLDIPCFESQITAEIRQIMEKDADAHLHEILAELRLITSQPGIQKTASLPENEFFPEHPVEGFFESGDGAFLLHVTGQVDALYNDDGTWVVRDYKTDVSRDRHSKYMDQVQIYLHLVKRLYRWENLRGEIYYTENNESVEVPFDAGFFNNLEVDDQKNWRPVYPVAEQTTLPPELEEPAENLLMIHPTRFGNQVVRQALASRRKLLPTMTFHNFASLNESINSGVPSQSLIRILLRKELKNRYKDRSFNEFPGLLSALSKAVINRFRHGETGHGQIEIIWKKLEPTLEKLGYRPYLDPDHSPPILSEKQIVVDGWVPAYRKEIDFVSRLISEDNHVHVLDPSRRTVPADALEPGNHPLWTNGGASDETRRWVHPFDAEEELLFIVQSITKELNRGTPFHSMVVVLPSMEKYVPLLKAVFSEWGIPVKLNKTEPYLERPAIQGLMAALHLLSTEDIKWEMLRQWFLHPISIKVVDGHPGLEAVHQLDMNLRRKGLIHTSFNRHIQDEELRAVISSFIQICSKKNQQVSDTFYQMVEKTIPNPLPSDDQEGKILAGFRDKLEKLNGWIKTYFSRMTPKAYLEEVLLLLKSMEFQTPEQPDGIAVVSVLDSIGFVADKITFVPGMTQNDFPSTPSEGFLAGIFPDYHFHTNFSIFNGWIRTARRVIFSCPQKDTDGGDQQYSVFLENYGSPEIPQVPRSPLTSYSRRIIRADGIQDELLQRQIRRHNALAKDPLKNIYFGILNRPMAHLAADRYFSASGLEKLTRSPLFFLMSNVWQVPESDKEDKPALILGEFVHDVLDTFGKQDGWSLNQLHPGKAADLLRSIVEEKHAALTQDNIELNAKLRPFVTGLDSTQKNLFLKILEEDRWLFSGTKFISSEQAFGFTSDTDSWPHFVLEDGNLGRLKFRGKIDRFDEQPETQTILGVDFKTGELKSFRATEDFPPQLKLYYLVLKDRYPAHHILMMYRQLKSLKNGKFGITTSLLGDVEPDKLPAILPKPKCRETFIRQKEVTRDILQAFEPFRTAGFPPFGSRVRKEDVRYDYLEAAARIETIRFIIPADESNSKD